jgi:UPF0176 protein
MQTNRQSQHEEHKELDNNLSSLPIINISCYKFITLNDRPALKTYLTDLCQQLDLKGTILLAEEGINIFLAGSKQAIDGFFNVFWQDARFADIQPKESPSNDVPFKRMRVRLKKEIITMRKPLIKPENHRAPSVSAETLRRWLNQGQDDQGKPVVLLDTRNDYEVACGTFENAVIYPIKTFGDFPEQIEKDKANLENKTIVSFCTGGIRCEKAALYMREIGLTHTYQLEGGILKYFEEVGGDHWQGACFVFDERVALQPDLTVDHQTQVVQAPTNVS